MPKKGRLFLVFLLTALLSVCAWAQDVSVRTSVSASQVQPGDRVTVRISSDAVPEAAELELIVEFDGGCLELVSADWGSGAGGETGAGRMEGYYAFSGGAPAGTLLTAVFEVRADAGDSGYVRLAAAEFYAANGDLIPAAYATDRHTLTVAGGEAPQPEPPAAPEPTKITVVFGAIADQDYTGIPLTPPVTLTGSGGERLTAGTDYTLQYSDNVGPGPAEVTAVPTGRGQYSFEPVSASFTILPPDKRAVALPAAPAPLVYNGQEQSCPIAPTEDYVVMTEGTLRDASAEGYPVTLHLLDPENTCWRGAETTDRSADQYYRIVITPAVLTVTALDRTVCLGEQPFAAEPEAGEDYRVSGLCADDRADLRVTLGCCRNGRPALVSEAGTYELVPTVTGVPDNYTLRTVSGRLTVTAPPAAPGQQDGQNTQTSQTPQTGGLGAFTLPPQGITLDGTCAVIPALDLSVMPVVLDLSGLGARVETVVLPGADVRALAADIRSRGLTVRLSDGTLQFDADALTALAAGVGEDLSIAFYRQPQEELSPARQKALNGQALCALYRVRLMSGGVRLADPPDGTVTVRVSPKLETGMTPGDLAVYGFEDPGALRPLTHLTDADGVRAELASLDSFAVLYEPALAFTDVSANAYYADAVRWAVRSGITKGVSATKFGPNDACTRAQTVTFLWRAAGCPQPTRSTCPFTDVPAGAYYRTAVLWAVEQGITNGISATKFGPGRSVTRAQAVTFLFRMVGGQTASADAFTDVPRGAYYAPAVGWAVDAGVTNGTSRTRFSPGALCTRAQIVTFLYRALVG